MINILHRNIENTDSAIVLLSTYKNSNNKKYVHNPLEIYFYTKVSLTYILLLSQVSQVHNFVFQIFSVEFSNHINNQY